jgi:hypothetical protein
MPLQDDCKRARCCSEFLLKRNGMGETDIIPTQAEAEEHRQHKRELDRQRGVSSRRGRPKGTRHGLFATMARVKLQGLSAIDMRTSAARELLQWKQQLIADLGGEENITTARMTLIDLAARTRALISHADGWLLAQPSLVNKRRKSLPPIVMQRQSLCDALARTLNMLGLDRVEKRVSLTEYLVSKKEEPTEPEP